MIEIDVEREFPMVWDAFDTPPRTSTPQPAILRVIDAQGNLWRREFPGSFHWMNEAHLYRVEWHRLVHLYGPLMERAM